MVNVNWTNIANAIDFYKKAGYIYIDTPWLVTKEASDITSKGYNYTEKVGSSYLVGSAEQGFLQLALDNKIKSNINLVSCGPCFRYGDANKSDFHVTEFVKVELFTIGTNEHQVKHYSSNFVNHALYLLKNMNPVVVKTQEGFDIEINGIEVGSYGYDYEPLIGWWAYGTGLAEPRISMVGV